MRRRPKTVPGNHVRGKDHDGMRKRRRLCPLRCFRQRTSSSRHLPHHDAAAPRPFAFSRPSTRTRTLFLEAVLLVFFSGTGAGCSTTGKMVAVPKTWDCPVEGTYYAVQAPPLQAPHLTPSSSVYYISAALRDGESWSGKSPSAAELEIGNRLEQKNQQLAEIDASIWQLVRFFQKAEMKAVQKENAGGGSSDSSATAGAASSSKLFSPVRYLRERLRKLSKHIVGFGGGAGARTQGRGGERKQEPESDEYDEELGLGLSHPREPPAPLSAREVYAASAAADDGTKMTVSTRISRGKANTAAPATAEIDLEKGETLSERASKLLAAKSQLSAQVAGLQAEAAALRAGQLAVMPLANLIPAAGINVEDIDLEAGLRSLPSDRIPLRESARSSSGEQQGGHHRHERSSPFPPSGSVEDLELGRRSAQGTFGTSAPAETTTTSGAQRQRTHQAGDDHDEEDHFDLEALGLVAGAPPVQGSSSPRGSRTSPSSIPRPRPALRSYFDLLECRARGVGEQRGHTHTSTNEIVNGLSSLTNSNSCHAVPLVAPVACQNGVVVPSNGDHRFALHTGTLAYRNYAGFVLRRERSATRSARPGYGYGEQQHLLQDQEVNLALYMREEVDKQPAAPGASRYSRQNKVDELFPAKTLYWVITAPSREEEERGRELVAPSSGQHMAAAGAELLREPEDKNASETKEQKQKEQALYGCPAGVYLTSLPMKTVKLVTQNPHRKSERVTAVSLTELNYQRTWAELSWESHDGVAVGTTTKMKMEAPPASSSFEATAPTPLEDLALVCAGRGLIVGGSSYSNNSSPIATTSYRFRLYQDGRDAKKFVWSTGGRLADHALIRREFETANADHQSGETVLGPTSPELDLERGNATTASSSSSSQRRGEVEESRKDVVAGKTYDLFLAPHLQAYGPERLARGVPLYLWNFVAVPPLLSSGAAGGDYIDDVFRSPAELRGVLATRTVYRRGGAGLPLVRMKSLPEDEEEHGTSDEGTGAAAPSSSTTTKQIEQGAVVDNLFSDEDVEAGRGSGPHAAENTTQLDDDRSSAGRVLQNEDVGHAVRSDPVEPPQGGGAAASTGAGASSRSSPGSAPGSSSFLASHTTGSVNSTTASSTTDEHDDEDDSGDAHFLPRGGANEDARREALEVLASLKRVVREQKEGPGEAEQNGVPDRGGGGHDEATPSTAAGSSPGNYLNSPSSTSALFLGGTPHAHQQAPSPAPRRSPAPLEAVEEEHHHDHQGPFFFDREFSNFPPPSSSAGSDNQHHRRQRSVAPPQSPASEAVDDEEAGSEWSSTPPYTSSSPASDTTSEEARTSTGNSSPSSIASLIYTSVFTPGELMLGNNATWIAVSIGLLFLAGNLFACAFFCDADLGGRGGGTPGSCAGEEKEGVPLSHLPTRKVVRVFDGGADVDIKIV